MPQAVAPIAGSVVGGLMSKGSSGGQTATKDPWKPAVKPLTDTLEEGQRLQGYYRQNPLNAQQQQGYENLFSDLDLYRNQIMPGMAQLAAGMMGRNYQRGPRNSQLDAMGVRDMRGQDSHGYGMGQMVNPALAQGPAAGLLALAAPTGAKPTGSYGAIDWVQSNPFTRDNGAMNKPPEQAPAKPVEDKEMEAWQRAQYENWLMDQRSGN